MHIVGKRWNVDLINMIFSEQEAVAILQMPINRMDAKDRIIWAHAKNGIYSVNTAYRRLEKGRSLIGLHPESSSNREQETKMWKRTWGVQISKEK